MRFREKLIFLRKQRGMTQLELRKSWIYPGRPCPGGSKDCQNLPLITWLVLGSCLVYL